MKIRISIWTLVVCLFATIAVPCGLAAQDRTEQNQGRHHHYQVVDLGTLGGANSGLLGYPSRALTNNGAVIGFSDTKIPDPFAPDCFDPNCVVQRSFIWQDGRLASLPSLTKKASSFPTVENDRQDVTGVSETGWLDPPLGTPQYAAVLWRNGAVIDLGTFGGASSVAYGVNNRGEVVGGASNGNADPYSMLSSDFFIFSPFPADTESRAFVWVDGLKLDLGTLGGPDSIAIFINDKGQTVGISYTSDTPAADLGVPPIGTFVWRQGRMTDIGGLGGNFTQPVALNQQGEIVGQSLLAGDQVWRSFIWRDGSLKDLGSLGGDNVYVYTINDEGVATGYSDIPPGTPVFGHPFIWKNGHMIDLGPPPAGFNCAAGASVNRKDQVVGQYGCDPQGLLPPFIAEFGLPLIDLNNLAVPGTKLNVQAAISINDKGEIACVGVLPNGDQRACLMVPLDCEHEWNDDATAGMPDDSAFAPRSLASPGNTPENSLIKFFAGGAARGLNLPIPNRTPSKPE